MSRDVMGLHLIETGRADDGLRRVHQQLRAADALVTVHREAAEPEAVQQLRRRAEQLLGEALYEAAEAAFLDAIDAGLQQDHFPWQAAVNLINCQRFLGRLEDADTTAAQLQEMYQDQPDHPIQYLLATQRGAVAADHFREGAAPHHAQVALEWARQAYTWQGAHRGQPDGLRAYNLIVALLRCAAREEALAVYHRHESDDDFQAWRRHGEQAAEIAALVGS